MKRQDAELEALDHIISLLDVNLYGGSDDGDLFAGILNYPEREQKQIKLAMGRELKRLQARYERLKKRAEK